MTRRRRSPRPQRNSVSRLNRAEATRNKYKLTLDRLSAWCRGQPAAVFLLSQLDVPTLRQWIHSWPGADWRIKSLPTMRCDPALITSVFTNLLSNAIKYSRHKECAIIDIGQEMIGGRAVIFVRDNGAGFDQEYAPKLFAVFQRLHRADEFEGIGVGLATVRRVLRKHGGDIWAKAEIAKGATFFFTIGAAPLL